MQTFVNTQRFNNNIQKTIFCKAACYRQIVIKLLSLAFMFLLLFSSVKTSVAANELELSVILSHKLSVTVETEVKDRLAGWQGVISNYKDLDEKRKLEIVNSFFNKARYINDIDHWEKEDYWATPLEFLSTNGGDCEDFSIAKYFTLKKMGVPVEKMRLMYVKAIELNMAHMVLTYYPSPEAEPVILDNLINEIKLASNREDLVPVYSFNGDSLWLAKKRGNGKRVGSSRRIKLWQELGLRVNI